MKAVAAKKSKRRMPMWIYPGVGMMLAWTRSEARAVVKKHLFTLFRCTFTVDVPGPDDIEAQGSFLDMEYTFTRAGQTIAEVSKRWFSFNDSYGVDIHDGQDDVLILASTVVIDMVCHSDQKRA